MRRRVVALARTDSLLLVALVFATVTRLGWLDLVEFKSDESVGLTIAVSIARGQALPLIGVPDWSGSPYPPFFVYLMALPELVSHDPAVATGFIGLLGLLAIAATFELTRSLFGRVAGAAAALFYAVSPWGIIYSRKVWDQDALPLFVTLGFFCLVSALQDRRRFLILPGLTLLTLATQLHPTAYPLAAPAGVLIAGCFWCDRRHAAHTAPWLIGGISMFALLESPYLLWQARNGWPIMLVAHRLTNAISQTDLSALRLAASAAVGDGYTTLGQVSNEWWLAGACEAILFVVGLLVVARLVIASVKVERRLIGASLILWLAAPILPQVHHSIPLYPHYFIVLYPLPFMLMGLATSVLWRADWATLSRRASLPSRLVLSSRVVAVGAILIPAILGTLSFSHYIAALRAGDVQDGFGVPLDRQEALTGVAPLVAPGGVVYLAAHGDLAKSLSYLADGQWRVFDDRSELVLPRRDSSAVLVMTDPTALAGQLAGNWFGHPANRAVLLTDQNRALLYRVEPLAAASGVERPPAPIEFEDGLALAGFRIHSDVRSDLVSVDFLWAVDRELPAKVPTVFNHLVDSSGHTLSQSDGLVYQQVDWQPGEYFVTQYSMSRPSTPDTYDLQVGLYDYPSMRRFRVLDPLPGGSADSVDLGTVNAPPNLPGSG